MEINENKFKVRVKTNSSKNEIIGYDKENNYYKIDLKASPIEGEANKELIKFLSRKLKKQIRIVYGFTSKDKIIEVF